jgi:hypothetical protein
MRKLSALIALAFVAIALGFATPAFAQLQTGSILVRAVDADGVAVPGATVTIRSPNLMAPQLTGTTDQTGAHRFPSLPPGLYTVQVDLQGFQSLLREGIQVRVGGTATIDFALELANVEETITVTADSPVVDLTAATHDVNLDAQLLSDTPGGRDIWSIVEYKVPGLVMGSPDVGGNQGGLQRSITARGTPNNQNTQMLNGVNVGDPAAIGFAGYYYDPSALEDVQVSTGAQDITVPAGGVFINMVTKSGRNDFNASALFTYQGSGTQWDNIDQTLQDEGIRPEANAVDRITNFNVNAGGAIIQDKLFIFGALNDQRIHVNVVGFPAVPTPGVQNEPTDITSVFARPTWQVNEDHRLDFTVSWQVYDKVNRGASASNTPESSWHEHDILAVYQGLWNWILNNNLFAETRISFNSIDFPLQLKTDQQTLFDFTTGFRTRANTNEFQFDRQRLQFSSNWQYYVPEDFGGRHELRFGIDNAYTPDSVGILRNDQVGLRYRSLTDGDDLAGPVDVDIFNTPLEQKRAVDTLAIYGQDTFSTSRFTFTGGLRFERVEGWLPAQESPPSEYFPEGTVIPIEGEDDFVVQRSFGEVRDIPLWHNLGPRGSVVYDLFGDGRTALKASAARYYDIIGTGTPGNLNPNGTIQSRYVWNDLNGDLLFQDGEQGDLLFTAVPETLESLRETVAEDLRRPYRNEWTVGIDHELRPLLLVSATWIQRQEHDPITTIDSVPFDAYTPVDVVEPGRDGVSGTADDQMITVFNENEPLQTHVQQQRNDNRVAERYKGLELLASKRYSNGWQLLGGYTWSDAEVDADDVESPNDLVNAAGPSGGRAHQFKVTGSYLFPYEIMFSGNFRFESGPYITRNVNISGLNQGTINVNAEPRGDLTLDWLPTLDLRARKSFTFGNSILDLDVDIYNLTNANTVFNVRQNTGLTNVRQAGDPNGQINRIPTFLSPTGILGPRIIRFNVGFSFGS